MPELPEVETIRRQLAPDLEGQRLEAMDRSGVDVQVLSSWIDMTGYALDARSGAGYSRRLNEVLAEEASSAPGRFLALGTVPLLSLIHI